MAWQARVASPIVPSETNIILFMEYFDDAQPTEVLATASFAFDPSWSNADMVAAVRNRGAELRAARNRATTLATNFPVGTTVNIP